MGKTDQTLRSGEARVIKSRNREGMVPRVQLMCPGAPNENVACTAPKNETNE